jgi:TPR repeat protein
MMMTNMKHLLLLCILLISFNSFADELSDAHEAYERGDYTTAITSYTKAAEQGDATAQVSLGLLYDVGKGTPQDYKQAIKWFTKAAEQGDVGAQFTLGLMYRNGDGTPQDNVMAYMLWNIAVANGYKYAKGNRDIVAKEMTSEKILEAQQLAREWMKKY